MQSCLLSDVSRTNHLFYNTMRKLINLLLLSKLVSSLADVKYTIFEATQEIWKLIEDTPSLGPKFVRLAFHDCVGGCDGCVNMGNPDNAGLDDPMNALNDVVSLYENELSRADIWALAGIVGTNFGLYADGGAQNFFELSEIGRVNCGENQDEGPDPEMPSANLDTEGVLDYFADNFNFDDKETVAIMGAHTLGSLSRLNSGYRGHIGWVHSNDALNNAYYKALVGEGETIEQWLDAPDYTFTEIINVNLTPSLPNRFQWDRSPEAKTTDVLCENIFSTFFGDDSSEDDDTPVVVGLTTMMTNADISMVRTFGDDISNDGDVACAFKGPTACPAAKTLEQAAMYSMDNNLWLTDFKATWEKMVSNGCDTCTSLV